MNASRGNPLCDLPQQRLVLRFPPLPDEGLLEFTLRLADANGCPPSVILTTLRDRIRRSSLSAPAWFASFVGSHEAEVRPLLSPDPSASARGIPNHGLQRRYLRTIPQVCPDCLSEKGSLRSIWQLKYYTACTTHGTRLVDRCTTCNTYLSWSRRAINQCANLSCRHRLLPVHQASPTNEELSLAALMERIFSGVPGTDFAEEIEALSLCELSALVEVLSCPPDQFRDKRSTERPESYSAAVISAWHAISEWPRGIHDYIRLVEKGFDPKSHFGAQARYGRIIDLLVPRTRRGGALPVKIRKLLARELQAVCGRDLVLSSGPKSIRETDPSKRDWISKNEAAHRLNIERSTLDTLLRVQRIPVKEYRRGNATLLLINREALDRIANDLHYGEARSAFKARNRLDSVQNVAHLLGTKNPTVRELAGLSLIGAVSYKEDVLHSLADAERILSRIGTLSFVRNEDVTVASFREAARRWPWLTVAGLVDAVLKRDLPVCTEWPTRRGLNKFGIPIQDLQAHAEPTRPYLTAVDVASLLMSGPGTVRGLVSKGLLAFDAEKIGASGRVLRQFDRKTVEAFRARYAVTTELECISGLPRGTVLRKLREAEVEPLSRLAASVWVVERQPGYRALGFEDISSYDVPLPPNV